MALTQQERTLKLSTPLGEDVLLLTGFTGKEEVSRLFRFQLDMISDDAGIQAADIVGKDVTFSIEMKEGGPRFFHGFVSQLMASNEDQGRREYRAEVVPWLWFLTQTADCRIFQDKTIKDIIETIFGDLGFSDYKFDLQLEHKEWEYCVQYRETDFNFVSRLMEQEGVSYWFDHSDGEHEMVISDHTGAYQDCDESEVDFPGDVGVDAIDDHITSWEHRYAFVSGKWAQTDYNFKTPGTNLMTNEPSVVSLPGISKYEVYDYPGEYSDKGVGKTETKLRIEEEEASYDVVSASSQCKSFTPGGKFKIGVHPSSSEEGKGFVITSITHSASEQIAYESGASVGQDYSNSFTCIPDSVIFRPARITPKPLVSGVQTAVVVGPEGEEISTDEYGRVKVHFFWEREGHSSCWMRVSQNWAGKNWGIVFNPRIGHEVIVDFLEGDPDRPIIVGRVYNAANMPPYELPGDQTRSTIKSRSSKGGSEDNFNEIRFEDKMGDEEIYVHAEKDRNTVIENNDTILIGFDKTDPGDQTIGVHNDRVETIGRDRSLDVGRDKMEHVVNDKTIQVDGGHTETIGKSMTITVGSSLTETVAMNYAETVGAAMQLSVGGALAITVGLAMTETVGGVKAENIGVSKTENIGTNKALSVGATLSETIGKDRDVNIQKDFKEKIGGKATVAVEKEYMLTAKKINVVAKDELQLKVGKAEITMKKNGDISIKGKKISVKGSSDVIVKGSKIKEN
ncbi:MAG: type VI secretion system tip protein VgrG [Planctomycetaceae bacterium]|nr:type VI secretion system tip protein VgrG [Planctomycetaceae bacterium]